jgi:hypothetical protein
MLGACSSSGPKAVDPCTLLTRVEISREVGFPVTEGGRTKSDADHSTGCVYGVTDDDPATVADVQVWTGVGTRLYDSLVAQGAADVAGTANPTIAQALDRLPPTDVAASRRGNEYVVVYAYEHTGAAARLADQAASNLP